MCFHLPFNGGQKKRKNAPDALTSTTAMRSDSLVTRGSPTKLVSGAWK